MYMIRKNPYRKKIRQGDAFLLEFPGDLVAPVLVARVRPKPDDMVFCGYLIYVNNLVIKNVVSTGHFLSSNMMLSPYFINRIGWSRGYFERYEAGADDLGSCIAKEHCFCGCYYSMTGCVNEWGEPVPCVPWASRYGVGNYRSLDRHIARKMGWDLSKAGVD